MKALTTAKINAVSKVLRTNKKKSDAINVEMTAEVMTWVTDAKATETFLGWLTNTAIPVKDETDAEKKERTQSNKDFQNIVNQTTFQREYFGIAKGQPLTEELRVKKAKTTMVTDGLATQSELEDKEFHKFTRKLDTTVATAKTEMVKFMAKWGLTPKQTGSLANACA